MNIRHVYKEMPFTTQQLHELAWDVENYPKFINFITALRILKVADNQMRAEVRVKYKMIRESFITDVLRDQETNEISVQLVKGPLNKLQSHWRFHQLLDGTTLVEFWVDFAFSVPLIGKMFAAKQIRAEQAILSAFAIRANQLFTPIEPDPDMRDQVVKQIANLQAINQH